MSNEYPDIVMNNVELNKIKAEIEQAFRDCVDYGRVKGLFNALDIIDKYREKVGG